MVKRVHQEKLKNKLIRDILVSSITPSNLDEILNWIESKNRSLKVEVVSTTLSSQEHWFIDKQGVLRNKNSSFFSIHGLRYKTDLGYKEQPIIIQDEVGYLGIICQYRDGILHFLMQAKIEPGNINKIQISPTIQATKSNFQQKHGGKKPLYLEYFLDNKESYILVDQFQSEQSSRFLAKRNRNIIIYVENDIEVHDSHKWMTLYQIKQLMKIDNIVNMDTRTVLSCIPISQYDDPVDELKPLFKERELFKSMFDCSDNQIITDIYHSINDYKMFNKIKPEIIPLTDLNTWTITDKGIFGDKKANFSVIYCDISIEKREVTKWFQPLLAATGRAFFGLFTSIIDGERKFLVQIKPEIGSFDSIEIGPTLQLEHEEIGNTNDLVDKRFLSMWKNNEGVLYNVLLSEEGGRFYQEENYNVIINVDFKLIEFDKSKYFWVSYQTLNRLIQINNCVNIQLRNLLSLLEI